MLGRIRKWWRREEGAAAVEFALLAMPFFLMLMGILEINFYFATGVLIEGATNDAARKIRTGQVQNAADPVRAFEDSLCDGVSVLVHCADLQYEVIKVPDNSFSNAWGLQPQFDEMGDLVSAGFDPGGASDAILVRVVYRYPFLIPTIGKLIAPDSPTGLGTLMSTTVIRNEPYRFGS